MAVLEIERLRVEIPTRRGTLVALDDVSLEIAAGEVLGVVGESGAGKSMTGAAVLQLLAPPGRIAGGEVRLEGQRIDRLPAAAMRRIRGRKIAVIFQDPMTSLNPLFTVGDQIQETILAHLDVDQAEARQRALGLLHEVGIPAAEERFAAYPHQLSGGMRQRVVIALALCAEPKVIVADEPTTALDVSIQAQIISVLRRLCRGHGTAVMLITHDMGVIAETADRVAVMYAGRVVEIGPTADVIRRPLHPYTKGLMAAIPRLHAVKQRMLQIPGAMPGLAAIPPGCAFHPRCPVAVAACARALPDWDGTPEHRAACRLVAGAPSAEVPSAEVPSAEVPSAEAPSAEAPSA
jgi:peptide/nickel transport system ATP-binding protein